MNAQHSNRAVRELRRIATGQGGQTLIVTGPAEGPFYAGGHRSAVPTLLQAILTVVASAPYQQILVLTGLGEHLPAIDLSPELIVGNRAAAWFARGQQQVEIEALAPKPRHSDEKDLRTRLKEEHDKSSKRVVFLSNIEDWSNHFPKILSEIETACGWQNDGQRTTKIAHATVTRTLILLDEAILQMTLGELGDVLETRRDLFPLTVRRNYEQRFEAIPDKIVRDSPVDLILFAFTPGFGGVMEKGTFLRDQASRIAEQSPVISNLPLLRWKDKDILAVNMTKASYGPYMPEDANTRRLSIYNAFRTLPIQKAVVKARCPEDPRKVDIAFWANLNVNSLQKVLEREVIGQREAIKIVCNALADYRQTCEDALPHEARLKNEQLPRPPVFLFMGESGMGKTYMAQLIAKELFGDRFHEKIELTGKTCRTALQGGETSYIGYGDTPFFLEYCRRTGGIGLVLFDELDKVKRENDGNLANAINPFLEVISDRQLLPNNPSFANCEGRAHFANLVLVFAANVIEAGERSGYVKLEDFGTPLLGRITHKIPFGEMQSEDVVHAIKFFLPQYLSDVLGQLFMETEKPAIDPRLEKLLIEEFDTKTTKRRDSRTFRTLRKEFLEKRLPPDTLKKKFRTKNFSVGSMDLSTVEWKPV